MATRRLNYTGRRRITQDDIRIALQEHTGAPPTFDANVCLDNYGLPADALVFLEAQLQTRWMRFPLGTVGNRAIPADRTLSEFDSPEGVLFRVKVTSASDRQGVMLAEADGIRPGKTPDDEQNQTPLLPVKPEDLGDEIYRVDFTNEPVMLVNNGVHSWQMLARSPIFISLVYPAVLREIMVRIMIIEEYFEIDDLDRWESRWLNFARNLSGMGDIPAGDDSQALHGWIDDAVASFARMNRIADRFHTYWEGGKE